MNLRQRIGASPEVARRAFTLTETIVAVGTAAVLMAGLGSTVYLVSQATGDSDRPVEKVVAGSLAISDIAAELHYAISFGERSNHAVEFTVSDRTGDGAPETIRYEWSGTPGSSITRSFNNAAPESVCENVYDFQLGYTVQTVEESADEEETPATIPTEVLAASFAGWSGVTPTVKVHSITATTWVSEYFELAWPAGATSFSATKLRLKLGRSITTGQFSVGFYTAANGTGPLPSTTLLGSQQTISTAALPLTPDWMELAYSNVTMTDPTSGYNIVLKGIVAGGKVGYLYSLTAPQDATVNKWSTTSGSSWSPFASQEKNNDIEFELYGIFAGGTTQTETPTLERHFVRAVQLTLQSGEAAHNRISTAIDILNAPEVVVP